MANNIYPVSPQKRPPFYFLNNSVKILTDFNKFWYVKSWENLTWTPLQICPHHVSDVATLPWEIQKSHFSKFLFIVQIIYDITEENK